jgi:hypothetical protein
VKTLGRHPNRDAAFAASPNQVVDLRLSHSSLMSLAPAGCLFLRGSPTIVSRQVSTELFSTPERWPRAIIFGGIAVLDSACVRFGDPAGCVAP